MELSGSFEAVSLVERDRAALALPGARPHRADAAVSKELDDQVERRRAIASPLVARVTIGPARQILAREFVEASYSYGRGRWFVLFRHVLPNIGPLIIVQGSVMFASAILIEASLSYLGVGAQRPTPSWGRLLNEALPLIDKAPSLMIFPGAAIMISVLGFNLLGDGLRTMLDPQQQSGSARIA